MQRAKLLLQLRRITKEQYDEFLRLHNSYKPTRACGSHAIKQLLGV